MRYILSFFVLLLLSNVDAQHCGSDIVQQKLEDEFPEIRESRLKFERALRLQMENNPTLSYRSENYSGPIYKIPVVIHVIEGNGASVTDAQISTWLENNNKIFATTYGGDFYAEGTGPDGGTVIPFRLELAQRTPDCQSTTGIVRYNGSTLSGYDTNGIKLTDDNLPAPDENGVKGLAPHWPEHSYFNVYIVTGIDADFNYNGVLGWCRFPTTPDAYYDSFMKMAVVTQPNDSTMAHEFGHGMGLYHPFQSASSQGGECPTNGNCATDNDMVCDTEAVQSLLGVYPVPSNTATNPCTNNPYQGEQYNIMGYTYSPRKFTPGQRERALNVFMANRSNLTQSLGATPPGQDNSITLVDANCTIAGVTNPDNYNAGPTGVKLNTINNVKTSGYLTYDPKFYVDYTTQNCLNTFVTDVTVMEQSTLKVTTNTNAQFIKGWIDYNNNGDFENNELIANIRQSSSGESTFNFTPPSTAVLNTYLRMRIITDINSIPDCSQNANRSIYRQANTTQLYTGQAEDYAVRILPNTTLPVDLSYFDVEKLTTSVNLTWATLSEINNDEFLIEHSTDGKEFIELSSINGQGNSSELTTYYYNHGTPINGQNFYRLSQVDFDGNKEVLMVKMVEFKSPNTILVYPNPTRDVLSVRYNDEEQVTLDLLSITGQVLPVKMVENKGIIQVDMSDLSRGVYLLKVKYNNSVMTRKVMKK